MEYIDKYLPVDLDFEAGVVKYCHEDKVGKIHFYNDIGQISQSEGKANKLIIKGYEKFIVLNESPIRLDKIITLFGHPGPAYHIYENHLNSCLTCASPD